MCFFFGIDQRQNRKAMDFSLLHLGVDTSPNKYYILWIAIMPHRFANVQAQAKHPVAPQVGTTELDDLVVTASVPLVHSDGAKLTYNVTEDPEAKSSNTLDILRKVPGVTVDAQENVKVNGQSSFKIFLNGKEDPMLSGDIKTILKSMPASTIQKIEVISEPGAKYEAEGTGGILNTQYAVTVVLLYTN